MRLSEGVEWTVHACVLLARLPAERALPGAAIAEFLGVAPAYLAKHMQALSRAGLVATSRGAAGGYRLAKPACDISLYEVVAAVEGSGPAFRCQEIRQRGPVGAPTAACKLPCGIASSFYAAERAWRTELEKVTIAAMLESAGRPEGIDPKRLEVAAAWFSANLR